MMTPTMSGSGWWVPQKEEEEEKTQKERDQEESDQGKHHQKLGTLFTSKYLRSTCTSYPIKPVRVALSSPLS